MNKYVSIILFISIISANTFAQQQEFQYRSDNFYCTYHMEQGKISGKYTAYYPDGVKKAEGEMHNGYKTGTWNIWNKEGVLCISRNYSSPLEYEQSLPQKPDDPLVSLLNYPPYTLEYNKDGYIEYFMLEERMLVWAKRIWRRIDRNQTNTPLFKDDLFFQNIYNAILQGEITAYSPETDDFTLALAPSDLQTNKKVIAYKIKEDWFFDSERFLMEVRPLGICPVVYDSITNTETELCWLYFPELRKLLASIKLEQATQRCKTYDDLFFFRDYASLIYKESNVYDRELKDYLTEEEIEKEAISIEMEMINTEHDILLEFFIPQSEQ